MNKRTIVAVGLISIGVSLGVAGYLWQRNPRKQRAIARMEGEQLRFERELAEVIANHNARKDAITSK